MRQAESKIMGTAEVPRRRDGQQTGRGFGCGIARTGRLFLTAGLGFALLPLFSAVNSAMNSAWAQEIFMGVEVSLRPGPYLVMKDVNVRAKPKKTSKKVGKLRKGDRVQGMGRAVKSSWIGVQVDGKDLGFVYSPILMPLIDGELKNDLTGTALTDDGTSCRYTVSFEDMGEVQGAQFQTADYEVGYECLYKGRHFSFTAPMFITEAPYQLSIQNPVYQISIDILEVEEGYDEVFSTSFLYRLLKDQVVYAGASLKGYDRSPKVTEKPAASVEEALSGAVEMAVSVWNGKVWESIAKGE